MHFSNESRKRKTIFSWPLTLIMQKRDHFRLLRHHYSESPVIPLSDDIWYRCVAHEFITFYFWFSTAGLPGVDVDTYMYECSKSGSKVRVWVIKIRTIIEIKDISINKTSFFSIFCSSFLWKIISRSSYFQILFHVFTFSSPPVPLTYLCSHQSYREWRWVQL